MVRLGTFALGVQTLVLVVKGVAEDPKKGCRAGLGTEYDDWTGDDRVEVGCISSYTFELEYIDKDLTQLEEQRRRMDSEEERQHWTVPQSLVPPETGGVPAVITLQSLLNFAAEGGTS